MPAYKHFKYYPAGADQYNELWAEACANEKAYLGADSGVQYYMDGLGLNYDAQGYKDFMIWGTGIYTQEGKTTNWLDEVTRTGFTQNYSVDVQGGGAVAGTPSYYLSLDYLKDQAIVIGKDLQRGVRCRQAVEAYLARHPYGLRYLLLGLRVGLDAECVHGKPRGLLQMPSPVFVVDMVRLGDKPD